MQIFEDAWNEERQGIFEPILFQGTENMLVQDLGSRAVGQAEDDEEEKATSGGGMVNTLGGPAVTTTAPASNPAFDLDSMLGGPVA